VVKNLRHAHPGLGKAAQGVHLGILPSSLLLFAPIPGVLLHGARLAAVPPLAPFLVLRLLAEATFGGFLVHLGAADLSFGANHVDIGLLAAHELADDLIDNSVVY